MLPIKRRRKILEKLDVEEAVEVKGLADEFEVSETTIRRDLQVLEKKDRVARSYGGAIKLDENSTSFEPSYNSKKQSHKEEKEAIGRVASSLVKSGQTVVLDAGSTTLEVAKALHPDLNLTVITNDLKIAMVLTDKPNVELIVLGGKHRSGVYTLQGNIAEKTLQKFAVNRTFLGVDAIDKDVISNVNSEEVSLKKKMIEAGDEVTVVGDHSKFKQRVFMSVCSVDKIDSIITDQKPDSSLAQSYEEAQVDILVP